MPIHVAKSAVTIFLQRVFRRSDDRLLPTVLHESSDTPMGNQEVRTAAGSNPHRLLVKLRIDFLIT